MGIVAPEGTNQRTPSTMGIKVYGSFGTLAEANEYSKKCQAECDTFDYWVIENLEWVQLPPSVQHLGDIHFREKRMEDLKESTIKMREERARLIEEKMLEAREKRQKGLPADNDRFSEESSGVHS
jgi:hypothetical protein